MTLKLLALALLLLATSCAEPDYLYYQDIELQSEVISSSDPVASVTTELTAVPKDQSYPGEHDQIEINLDSGTRIYIESVLLYLINGRSTAESDGTLPADHSGGDVVTDVTCSP